MLAVILNRSILKYDEPEDLLRGTNAQDQSEEVPHELSPPTLPSNLGISSQGRPVDCKGPNLGK